MKPVIKWAGGKTSIMKILADYIYVNDSILYVEPFVGGGSVLFTFKPKNALISDVNANLMCMYHVIKYYPKEFVNSLSTISSLVVDKCCYTAYRARFNSIKFNDIVHDFNLTPTLTLIEIATLFVVLNKTCFNGLYRENSKCEYNVPYGKYSKFECDFDNILEISKYFNENNVTIVCMTFIQLLSTLDVLKPITLYLDPPYYGCNESKFTSYSGIHLFDDKQHEQLYKIVNTLITKSKGNLHVVCSNSYNEFTLQQNKLSIRVIEFSRNMDKKIVKEIVSYTPTSTLWKNLVKYLNGKYKFETTDDERNFIKLYSSSVLLNSAGRVDTFNIGKLGELHVKRIFAENGIDLQKCPFKESVRPDGFIEFGNHKFVVEIKSRTYTCTGTASEKIDCIPRKLSLIYKKYGYKSIVIFVAGQIIEKSGHAFLTNACDYVTSFKQFASQEAGIDHWLSIHDIPRFIKTKLVTH